MSMIKHGLEVIYQYFIISVEKQIFHYPCLSRMIEIIIKCSPFYVFDFSIYLQINNRMLFGVWMVYHITKLYIILCSWYSYLY